VPKSAARLERCKKIDLRQEAIETAVGPRLYPTRESLRRWLWPPWLWSWLRHDHLAHGCTCTDVMTWHPSFCKVSCYIIVSRTLRAPISPSWPDMNTLVPHRHLLHLFVDLTTDIHEACAGSVPAPKLTGLTTGGRKGGASTDENDGHGWRRFTRVPACARLHYAGICW